MTAAAKPHCSLKVLLAREAPDAIVFRRGPSRQTCLVSWDRSHDTFEVGQWFKGSVYPERSDLSPDGRWLVTFLGKFTGPLGTWTVLSRPPYFTAATLWPNGSTWGGGGFFLSDRELVLNESPGRQVPADGFSIPAGLVVRPRSGETDARIAAVLANIAAWPSAWIAGPAGTPERRNVLGALLTTHKVPRAGSKFLKEERFRFTLAGCAPIELEGAAWADFDANGDLLFAIGGRLYRLPAKSSPTAPTFDGIVDAASCLTDLSDLQFRNVAAPSASTLIAATPYEPLRDRNTRETRRERKKRRRMIART